MSERAIMDVSSLEHVETIARSWAWSESKGQVKLTLLLFVFLELHVA
jgi:hypothetical protein